MANLNIGFLANNIDINNLIRQSFDCVVYRRWIIDIFAWTITLKLQIKYRFNIINRIFEVCDWIGLHYKNFIKCWIRSAHVVGKIYYLGGINA